MTFKQEVFTGCERHKPPSGWNYYCHDCLVKAIAILTDKVEEMQDRLDSLENDPTK